MLDEEEDVETTEDLVCLLEVYDGSGQRMVRMVDGGAEFRVEVVPHEDVLLLKAVKAVSEPTEPDRRLYDMATKPHSHGLQDEEDEAYWVGVREGVRVTALFLEANDDIGASAGWWAGHVREELLGETARNSKVGWSPEEVTAYLDSAIKLWRAKKAEAEASREGLLVSQAADYIDAYQSVRASLFGSTLPPDAGQ